MISEIQTAYGSLVRLQGRSRRCLSYHASRLRRSPAMEVVLRQGAEAVPMAKAIVALQSALPEVTA